jgi:general secretion pathway protein G
MKFNKSSINRSRSSGFTLMEIIIVITLMGLIAAFAFSKISDQQGKAEARLAKSKVVSLSGPLSMYKLDTGKYPTTQEGLSSLVKAPSGVANWNGPYATAAEIKDHWRNDLQYTSPGSEGRPYEIVSLGNDGKPGGEGADRDIKSWE